MKQKLASAKKLSEVKAADYDVIFYVGGHGPVEDLVNDETNGKLASEVCEETTPLSARFDRLLSVLSKRQGHRSCMPWNRVGMLLLVETWNLLLDSALALAKDSSGKSIFAGGKRFTGFSNAEEKQALGENFEKFPYLLEDGLTALGGVYEKAAEPWGVGGTIPGLCNRTDEIWNQAYNIDDGNLFTGQNPASAGPLAEAIVAKLG